jgi:Ricin-type beta-trefoil lectin domain/Glycosyl hydrolases family 18
MLHNQAEGTHRMRLTEVLRIRRVRHRATALLGASVLAAGLGLVGIAAPAAQAAGTGAITGYEGLCLDDRSSSTTDFNPIQVYTCNGTAAQSWTVESNGSLEVVGKCLDVDAAGTANGTLVDLYDCNGTVAQVWQPQSNGSLLNPNSGKCLDDTGYGGSGTQVQIWSCTGNANQSWTLPTGSGGGGTGGGGSVGKVAPYVDMSNNQEPMLNSAAQAGLKTYTAAFVISAGCSPIWGDTLPVTNDPAMDQEIATAKADGATPIVSFGGAGGTELAMACTTESSLQAAYQAVINHLGVNHIDFDIEGAPLDYTSDNNLRFQAINGLEAANPGLVVSVTLPVLPSGLAADGVAFLSLAKSDGTRIDLVNVMAMDYGSSFTGDMGQEAIQAAESTLTQVKADWSSDTYANIGVTPMIGQNDTSGEIFSEADAQSLVSWADGQHLGRLSFWSVDRDQACGGSASGLPACSEISQSPLDFTKIFDSYSG